MAANIVLPWSHRAFSSLKRWALGTYHGLRRKHVDAYLEEFVFRYNRRFYRHVSFETVLGLAARRGPETYRDIVNATPAHQAAARNDPLLIDHPEFRGISLCAHAGLLYPGDCRDLDGYGSPCDVAVLLGED